MQHLSKVQYGAAISKHGHDDIAPP